MEKLTKHSPIVAETPLDSVSAHTKFCKPPILLAPVAGRWRVVELVPGRDAGRGCRRGLLYIFVATDSVVFVALDLLDGLDALVDRELAIDDGRL